MANQSPVHSQHHITPIKTYVYAWIALLILMALTVLASMVDLTPLGNNVAALGIAVTKAGIVVAFFMGVLYSTKLVKAAAIMAVVWICFMAGILVDYATRIPVKGFNNDFSTTVPQLPESAGQNGPSQDKTKGYIPPLQNPEVTNGINH